MSNAICNLLRRKLCCANFHLEAGRLLNDCAPEKGFFSTHAVSQGHSVSNILHHHHTETETESSIDCRQALAAIGYCGQAIAAIGFSQFQFQYQITDN